MVDLQNVEAIIFDFGNVIINIDTALTDQAFADHIGPDGASRVRATKDDAIFTDYEIAKVTSSEFRNRVRSILGISINDTEFDSVWNKLLLDIPVKRIEMLRRLGEKYRVFLFSNTNEIHYDYFLNYIKNDLGIADFSSLFEKAHYSFIEKVRKPDVDAYHHIIRKNGLAASRTLFVDDSALNIEGAKKAGLLAYHHAHGDIADIFG